MRFFLSSLILILTSFVNAQQTYVPDDNFEAYLENNAMGNGIPNDDYVTTANISGVGSLIVWGWNIADLTGIEDFTSLNTLYCFDNQLTTLDVSQNTMLSDFRCNDNQLTSLDVSQNTMLTTFFCYNNSLGTLDVTQNTILSDLRCFSNALTSIDVSPGPALSTLFCYDNGLTSLDVSQNSALSMLFCYDNQLSTLDVSQNTGLTSLRCFDNQLSTLDVSQNLGLTILMCYDNDLTSLDVSQNTLLVDLYCQNNQLECLNANNGQNINMDCSNNNISCASVVYPPWSNANAVYDAGILFDVLCEVSLDNDVDQVGTSLTAVQNGASYQWINCGVSDDIISGATNQTYTPTTTGYFAVEITLYDPCGGTYVDTSSCHLVDYTSLDELTHGKAELVKIVDLTGRETPFKPNTTLIYVFSDGTTQRVFKLEE